MKFRIVAVPAGQAPLWVREEWVGLELSTRVAIGEELLKGVLGGLPSKENADGFGVYGRDAIDALVLKNPKAAEWWKQNVPSVLNGVLVFGQKFCKPIR